MSIRFRLGLSSAAAVRAISIFIGEDVIGTKGEARGDIRRCDGAYR